MSIIGVTFISFGSWSNSLLSDVSFRALLLCDPSPIGARLFHSSRFSQKFTAAPKQSSLCVKQVLAHFDFLSFCQNHWTNDQKDDKEQTNCPLLGAFRLGCTSPTPPTLE